MRLSQIRLYKDNDTETQKGGMKIEKLLTN